MVLRKPSDFFENENKSGVSESIKDVEYFDTLQSYKKNLEKFDAISKFSGSLEDYNENVERVNYLSQQLLGVQEEIKTLLTREDLDRAMMSQLLVVEEITIDIQNRVKTINNEKLTGIKKSVKELTEQVDEFISVDVPKYKSLIIDSENRSYSRYDKFEGRISESVEAVQQSIQNSQQSIDDISNSVKQKYKEIDKNISEFQNKISEDLNHALMSQRFIVEQTTDDIQSKVKTINDEKLASIKESVNESVKKLTEQVDEFISVDVPKYKSLVIDSEKRTHSKYDKFEGKISESIENTQQSIDDVSNSVKQKYKEIDENILKLQDKLTDKISNIKKTVSEFIDEEKANISKNEIRVKTELEGFEGKLKEISIDVFESSEDNKNFKSELTERVDNFFENTNSAFGEQVREVEKIKDLKEELSKKVDSLEVNLVRNESHIKVQNESLDKIQVDVREAIEKLKIDELEEKNASLARKVDYIQEVLEKFSEKEVLTESITEPPATNNSDSLTPIDQNFVTFDQLQNHYRLFVNRIQQQLSTLGGGGEVRLEFLDDVDRNSAKVNGKFLKYDSSVGKWVGAGAGAGSQTLDETLDLGNTSSTGMSVGVVTATQFHGGGANITGISTLNIVNYGVGLGGGGSQTLDETLALGNTSSTGMSVGVVTTTELHVGVDTGFFTEDLVVNGDARITGILSVGTATITLDPDANIVRIGTGITLNANTNSIEVGGSKIADTSGNAEYSGIVTASSFVGDVTGTATTATNLNNQAASYYLDYDNFTSTPTIPTNNNELTNGAGYITTSFTNTNQLTNGAGFVTFTNNNQLTNGAGYITTSFTNTNQLTNGAGFITSSDDITGTSGGLTGSPSITVTDITAVGNVSIAGTLTYEDVTNVDSIGIATARTGLDVLSGGINVTGVSTFQSNVNLGDNDKLQFGDGIDLQIFSDGSTSYIQETNASSALWIKSNSTEIRTGGNQLIAKFDGGVELYYPFGDKKFETTASGIDVTGHTETDTLNVSGVSTFTNKAEVRSDDGSQGRIDFYCEVSNAHYTRIQAAAHADYSGNAIVTLPSSTGTLLLTDGDGSSLTSLNASNLGSGTIPDARFPATLPAVSGQNLTGIVTGITAGSNITVLESPSGNFIITATGGGGGDTVSINATATDILSVSSGDISADDAGSDKLVFWDDSESKLTYLTAGSGLSISGTTITASGGGGSSGIEIENNGTSVGTGITAINFSTNVTATASGGIATVTASGGGGSVDLLEVMLFT